MFADGIGFFAADNLSLQSQLNSIYTYSLKRGLKINVNKTKICIFEKRRRQNNCEWYINDEKLEIVESFIYLGMKLVKNGNLMYAVKTLSDQALRAMNNLLILFKKIKLDIKTKLLLFDGNTYFIIFFELWGIYEYKEIDIMQLTIYTILL